MHVVQAVLEMRKTFDLREVQCEAAKRNADPITILYAMMNGTLENVRSKK